MNFKNKYKYIDKKDNDNQQQFSALQNQYNQVLYSNNSLNQERDNLIHQVNELNTKLNQINDYYLEKLNIQQNWISTKINEIEEYKTDYNNLIQQYQYIYNSNEQFKDMETKYNDLLK